MNVTIIGAGPVGCYCGYLLAKSGHSVNIYENHAEIGLPVQCTGLLTADLEKFGFPLDSFLVNTFSQVEVISLSQRLKIAQKEYLVSRRDFDVFLAGLARKAGAKILLSHSFLRKEGVELIFKDLQQNKELRIQPEIVIAADGPSSPTAKAYGLYHPQRENYLGMQAVVEGKFDAQGYQAHFGSGICSGFFAWVVPESASMARVGLVSLKETRVCFNRFLKSNSWKIKEIQAGLIPRYCPKQKLNKENCYLVGDAASFVKATTLGGLIPGLEQAGILAGCLNEGKDYEKETKSLRRKLRLHLRLQEAMKKFSDQDWDLLVSYINQEKIKKVLQENTRDNPWPLLMKTLWKEPRILKLGRFLLKS